MHCELFTRRKINRPLFWGGETERAPHIQRQQKQLQSEAQYLDHGQNEVANKLQHQEAVVSPIEQQKALLGQGLSQTISGQTLSQ